MSEIETMEEGTGLRRAVSPVQAGIVIAVFLALLGAGYILLQRNARPERAAAPQAMSAVVQEEASGEAAPDEMQPRPASMRTHQDQLNQEKIENMKRGAMAPP